MAPNLPHTDSPHRHIARKQQQAQSGVLKPRRRISTIQTSAQLEDLVQAETMEKENSLQNSRAARGGPEDIAHDPSSSLHDMESKIDAQSTAPPDKGLLGLPVELQNRIYLLVVTRPRLVPAKISETGMVAHANFYNDDFFLMDPDNQDDPMRPKDNRPPQIMEVCRSIRKLVRPMYYGNNVFNFSPRSYFRQSQSIGAPIGDNFKLVRMAMYSEKFWIRDVGTDTERFIKTMLCIKTRASGKVIAEKYYMVLRQRGRRVEARTGWKMLYSVRHLAQPLRIGETQPLCMCVVQVDKDSRKGEHNEETLWKLLMNCVLNSPNLADAQFDDASRAKVAEMTQEPETTQIIGMLDEHPDRGLLEMSPCPSCKVMRILCATSLERIDWMLSDAGRLKDA
ncbi:unnamed protein product [Zymoseptoria tritici ST99CH_1A5]|uniref:F-box domain-containing protein n=1 Tax=Zymoseptoria tritici ST99CH_1A5 TaxID=1276529 RepID=A0A1Y6LN40_ZYMTR|nr:unnamed protein product [Zymoseptoria tritici ST99CH_1A5]